MKIKPQIIVKNNHPEFVVLLYEDYEKISAMLEELEDIKSIDSFRASKQEAFPMIVAQRIANGESPIRIFRELRKISQAALAKKLGISRQYLNQIESKARTGNVELLKNISKELHVSLDLII
jgi:mRNA interferase RelE/StbE